MAYVLVLDSDARSAYSLRFTKTVPRSIDPKSGAGRLCWIFLRDGGRAPKLAILGYIAKPHGEAVATDDRRILVEHARRLGEPVSLGELGAVMPTLHFNRLDRAVEEGVQVLPSEATNALHQAVVTLRPGLRQRLEWLSQLGSSGRVVSGAAGLHWAQERDAIDLALRMGGFPTTSLREWTQPADSNAPFSTGLVLGDDDRIADPGDPAEDRSRVPPAATDEPSEDSLADLATRELEASLIDADSRVIPGWQPIRRQDMRVDIREFADDRGRRIETLNVNAGPVETRIGVDLLYFHKSTSSLVGVQYKPLLDPHIYVDDRLRSQITRMKASTKALHAEPTSPEQWRVGHDWMYLKLARAQAMDPDAPSLLNGLYLPLSYLELLLNDEKVIGPKGGRRLGYDTVDRYLASTLFIDLVKEGWIGSPPCRPANLMDLARQTLADNRSAIIAMDHSDEPPRARQTRSRSRRSPSAPRT
ncbi:hypothetical protein [Actinomadura sp. 6N118]|uniref:hypothetical protein n=1 Tax=Actinomadura sp. 6N118 TaxID=3375151 RepID=UPI0037B5A2C0